MSRFNSVTDEQLAEIINDNDSQNTKKATQYSWAIFTSYVEEKQLSLDAKSIVKGELDAIHPILSIFYVKATKDTKFYSKSILCAIQFGIQPYFKAILSDVDTIIIV